MKGIKMRQQVISQARFDGAEMAKVIYLERKDKVVIEIGGTSLKLDATNFMLVNEMIRKAAARLVMQMNLHSELR